jgi:hypothetical protein
VWGLTGAWVRSENGILRGSAWKAGRKGRLDPIRSDPLVAFESFARWLYLRHAEPLRDRPGGGISFPQIRDDSLPGLTRSVRLLRFADEFTEPGQNASVTLTEEALDQAFAGVRDIELCRRASSRGANRYKIR